MTLLSAPDAALVKLMGEMPRGPRREGVFALWLTLRVAQDVFLVPPPPERAMRRRVASLALPMCGSSTVWGAASNRG